MINLQLIRMTASGQEIGRLVLADCVEKADTEYF
jgi:hypothetical protein